MNEFKYGEQFYSYFSYYRKENRFFRFRQGNVPGVRKYKPGSRTYRCPQVIFEPKYRYIADEDDGQNLTPHQIATIEKYRDWLPDPWDDIMDWSFKNRCWKQYRKTQYKLK